MLTVKGLPILVDELDILYKIREQVYQEQGREILAKIKKAGNNIMVCCPCHNEGQERKPSCGISLVERKGHPPGTWNCFACGERGTFELFVSKCFGYDDPYFGEKWLLENYVNGELYERPDIELDFSRNKNKSIIKQNYVSEEELAQYRFIHPYMYKRKLTDEIIEKYDVGYQKDYLVFEDKNTGYKKYDEVLTFPCRDINGNCLFVSRRSITGKSFYLPLNIEKPVYGVYELPENCDTAVICESVINALTVASYNIPALALFGTGTPYQMDQLNKSPVRSYILATDKDEAGRMARKKLRRGLKGKLIYEFDYNSYPINCNDINDMTKEQFYSLKIIF